MSDFVPNLGKQEEEQGTFQIFWLINTSYRKENFLGKLTNEGWLE